MEGPDNDANKNSNSTTSGGIFSTPDLTVDANNLAQPTPSNDKNRIASLFANTKTGRESQRLNDAMGMNNVNNSQPLEGDLVIQNNPKKKSKLPLILLVIVLLAAVIGVTSWIIISNHSRDQGVATEDAPATMQEAFDRLSDLIENGPENLREVNTSGQWFLYSLNDLGLADTERKDYLTDLRKNLKYYEEFVHKGHDATLQEQTTNFSYTLNSMINALDLTSLANEVLDKFVADGSNAAYSYINAIVDEDAEVRRGPSYSTDQLIHQYLSGQLSLIELYDKSGCIDNGNIDYSCVVDTGDTNNTLATLQWSQDDTRKSINSNLPALQSQLRSALSTLINSMKAENDN